MVFSSIVDDDDLEDDAVVGRLRRVVVERLGFFSVSESSEDDLETAVFRPRVHSPVK